MTDENDAIEDGEVQWEPLMPFVVCASQGGPFDDDSFAAGYALGDLTRALDDPRIEVYGAMLRSALVPQCDLLAMHLGYEMEARPWESDPDGWSNVVFSRENREIGERA